MKPLINLLDLKRVKERQTGLTFLNLQGTLINVKKFHGEFDPGSG